MKSMIAAVVGIAGLAAAANAAWGLRYEVSRDGVNWVSSIGDAMAGETIKIRFGAYITEGNVSVTTADGTGTAVALARFTGSNQITNLGAGDVIQNLVRTISSGNPALINVAGNTIGTSAVTSFGSQLFLGPLPTFEGYKEIFVGELKIVSGLDRVMTFKNKTFGSGATRGLTFYHTASTTNKQSGGVDTASGDRVDQEATITVVPTPASMALLGLGGLVAARRRRA